MLDFHTPCIPCLVKHKLNQVKDFFVVRRLKAGTGEEALPVYDNLGGHGYVFRSALDRVSRDFERRDELGLLDHMTQSQAHYAYLCEVVSMTNAQLMSSGPQWDKLRERNAELLTTVPAGTDLFDDEDLDELGGQA